MHRERWLIGLVAVVTILGTAMFGTYLVTEQNREAAVGKLKAKTAVIKECVSGRDAPTARKPGEEAPGPEMVGSRKTAPPGEDTVAAFAKLSEKRKALVSDPRWQKALELVGNAKWSEWTEGDRKSVAEFLDANRELILELRRLAELGGPMYDLDYSKGFAMELPHLAQLRDCARLLVADATLTAGKGDYGEAVKDILAGMKLANAVGKEPILISQLVRIAMDGIMYNDIAQSMRGEDLTPDQVRELIGYASRSGGRDGFADSFTGEGFFGLEAFDGIRTGDLNHAGMSPQGMDAFLMRVYGSGFARPFLNMDEETYADIMARMSDAARLPFCEAKPLLDQINTEIDDLPRTRFMSRTLLPALTRAAESQARHEAQLGLIQVGLAVELYHAQNGEYPRTLDQVAPTLGGTIPLDPFTGQAYVYEPSGGSFVLYSAMGSAVDMGGRSRPQSMDEQGNIVWRGPR